MCQRPVRELEEKKRPADRAQGRLERTGDQVFEADITEIQNNSFRAVLGEELILEYRSGRFEMRFSCRAKDSVSAGRGLRYKEMKELRDVKILADVSSVEVFLNGGEAVFSTRYYPKSYSLCVDAEGADIRFYEIDVQ